MWSIFYIVYDVIKYCCVYYCSEDKNVNGSGFIIGDECQVLCMEGYFLLRGVYGKVCGFGIYSFFYYLVISNSKFMCNLLFWKLVLYIFVF